MKALRKNMIVVFMIVTLMTMTAFAIGPVQKRLNFTIDGPFALEEGGNVLESGDYVLYQINQNNPKLFALYSEDLTNEPVAMIQTVRIDYQFGEYPEEATVTLNIDEESEDYSDLPVLTSWMIPGMDGWEVISVVE
jgi:hypothetical protein